MASSFLRHRSVLRAESRWLKICNRWEKSGVLPSSILKPGLPDENRSRLRVKNSYGRNSRALIVIKALFEDESIAVAARLATPQIRNKSGT